MSVYQYILSFQGSTSKRKFWPTGCLSTTSSTADNNDKNSTALVVPTTVNAINNNSNNSSLYSQYDVTLNSSVEMDAASSSHVCRLEANRIEPF